MSDRPHRSQLVVLRVYFHPDDVRSPAEWDWRVLTGEHHAPELLAVGPVVDETAMDEDEAMNREDPV